MLLILPPLVIPTRVAKCAAVMLVPEKAEAEYESIQRVLAARQQLSVIEVEEVVLDGRLVRRSSLIAIAAAVMELAAANGWTKKMS